MNIIYQQLKSIPSSIRAKVPSTFTWMTSPLLATCIKQTNKQENVACQDMIKNKNNKLLVYFSKTYMHLTSIVAQCITGYCNKIILLTMSFTYNGSAMHSWVLRYGLTWKLSGAPPPEPHKGLGFQTPSVWGFATSHSNVESHRKFLHLSLCSQIFFLVLDVLKVHCKC